MKHFGILIKPVLVQVDIWQHKTISRQSVPTQMTCPFQAEQWTASYWS